MDHTKNPNDVQNLYIVKRFNKSVPKELAHYVTSYHTSFCCYKSCQLKSYLLIYCKHDLYMYEH